MRSFHVVVLPVVLGGGATKWSGRAGRQASSTALRASPPAAASSAWAASKEPVGFQNAALRAELGFYAAGWYSLVGRPGRFQTSADGLSWAFYAAGSYSLIRPVSTVRRRIWVAG